MKINRNQFTLDDRWKDLLFHVNRGRGNLIRYSINRFRWHVYPRWQWLTPMPEHVDIELSNVCDMRCPMCYTVTEEFRRRVKPGLMEYDLFCKIIDDCHASGVYSIRLSFRGESFVHPRMLDMVRYAKERNIKEVSSLTNALKLTPEMFEEIVDAGLDWLTISFDGMGEAYNAIRAPAKFDEVVEKIKAFKAIKERRGARKPVVKVQSIYSAIAEDPDSFYDLFEPIADKVSANPDIDFNLTPDEVVYQEDFTCPTLWQRLVVAPDGRVLQCINDIHEDNVVGDLKVQTIGEVWKGEAMQRVREIHQQKRGYKELAACRACPLPRRTEEGLVRVKGRTIVAEHQAASMEEA